MGKAASKSMMHDACTYVLVRKLKFNNYMTDLAVSSLPMTVIHVNVIIFTKNRRRKVRSRSTVYEHDELTPLRNIHVLE